MAEKGKPGKTGMVVGAIVIAAAVVVGVTVVGPMMSRGAKSSAFEDEGMRLKSDDELRSMHERMTAELVKLRADGTPADVIGEIERQAALVAAELERRGLTATQG